MPVITKVRIENFRSIDRLDVELHGLTVLIGVNGSGKSTILEALQILRNMAVRPNDFADWFETTHGGIWNTFRRVPDFADRLTLGVDVQDAGRCITFSVTIARQNQYGVVAEEQLSVGGEVLVKRSGVDVSTKVPLTVAPGVAPNRLAIPLLASVLPEAHVIMVALEGIDVHYPFTTFPQWATRPYGLRNPLREPVEIKNTPRLIERFGGNLTNVFNELKSGGSAEAWLETMEYVRLGFGPRFDDLRIRNDGGKASLVVRFRGVAPDIGIETLSDGQLAYLAFVGMFRLEKHHAGYFGDRTLLAFDEPDVHLHPATLRRVVAMFEESAEKYPVVLATHSDALLDDLAEPDACVRVCELDEAAWATRIRQLDKDTLEKWLARYRGRLGALRADGYLDVVTRVAQ